MTKIFRIILFSYICMAFIGALILDIDIMRTRDLEFIDLFFTTASAICVTGLSTFNIANDLTTYGQTVILVLIQLGGFGFILITALFFVLFGQKFGFFGRNLLKEQINYPNFKGIVKFSIKIFLFVFVIESIGALLIMMNFSLEMSFKESLFNAIFHSVSAFNNAGFSTFNNNLIGQNFALNFIISTLIILGGLGFLVINELILYFKGKIRHLSIHAKIVLISTTIFLFIGFVVILLFEYNHALKNFGTFEKISNALFYSVNLRTAGFNTFDISHLNDQSLFFSSVLMVIGAGPGGTAGGIKVTTIAVLLIYTFRAFRGEEPVVFKREIPNSTIKKAFLILVSALFYIMLSALILSTTQDSKNEQFLEIFYEICSAFGTVGLSVGDGGVASLSAKFDNFGKIYIIILMFLGRVGVFAFSLAIITKNKKDKISYIEEDVIL